MNDLKPLRFGILGAARIAPRALIQPARLIPGVEVAAIAARDPARARKFARKHGLPTVHAGYAGLLADPEIDAVYIPLPISLHAEWTVRALRAGKHVLCEKPFAANAAEAEQMATAAAETGRVVAEAFHYRYHPLLYRLKEIVDSGELGTIRHIEAHFCIPFVIPGDIRYRYELGGGATMDVGCYPINLVRYLAGAEPQVAKAEARLVSPQVDRWMAADFQFANGRTGRVVCSLLSTTLLRSWAVVRGDDGEVHVINPFIPQFYNRLTITSRRGRRRERVPGEATYTYQLRAFVQAVRGDGSVLTDAADAVANMRVIDAIYDQAGLKRRGMVAGLARPLSQGEL